MVSGDASVAVRTGRMFELPEDELARAQYYICYERHFYYKYWRLRRESLFPLCYMDRCYSWRFEPDGTEPVISVYNGFMELVDAELRQHEDVEPHELKDAMARVLADGHLVSLDMTVVHTDGTPYDTAFLIEDMDDDGTVYFTKTNSTQNSVRRPLSFAGLQEVVAPEPDGRIRVTRIHDSAMFDAILRSPSIDAYQTIFGPVYGYHWQGDRLARHGTEVRVGVDGLDQLIESWAQRADELEQATRISKQDQFRLNKHIQNRFQPTQHYLQCVLSDSTLTSRIGPSLRSRAAADVESLDAVLRNTLKFGSLLVQRPGRASLGLYLKNLRALRALLVDYQAMHLQIQYALTAR